MNSSQKRTSNAVKHCLFLQLNSTVALSLVSKMFPCHLSEKFCPLTCQQNVVLLLVSKMLPSHLLAKCCPLTHQQVEWEGKVREKFTWQLFYFLGHLFANKTKPSLKTIEGRNYFFLFCVFSFNLEMLTSFLLLICQFKDFTTSCMIFILILFTKGLIINWPSQISFQQPVWLFYGNDNFKSSP